MVPRFMNKDCAMQKAAALWSSLQRFILYIYSSVRKSWKETLQKKSWLQKYSNEIFLLKREAQVQWRVTKKNIDDKICGVLTLCVFSLNRNFRYNVCSFLGKWSRKLYWTSCTICYRLSHLLLFLELNPGAFITFFGCKKVSYVICCFLYCQNF